MSGSPITHSSRPVAGVDSCCVATGVDAETRHQRRDGFIRLRRTHHGGFNQTTRYDLAQCLSLCQGTEMSPTSQHKHNAQWQLLAPALCPSSHRRAGGPSVAQHKLQQLASQNVAPCSTISAPAQRPTPDSAAQTGGGQRAGVHACVHVCLVNRGSQCVRHSVMGTCLEVACARRSRRTTKLPPRPFKSRCRWVVDDHRWSRPTTSHTAHGARWRGLCISGRGSRERARERAA